MSVKQLKVLVTGATGQIGYHLLFSLANGDVFGKSQEISLHLLAIPERMNALEAIKLELEDCSLPLLTEIIATDKEPIAFKNIDVAVLVGAWPRKENMARIDLLTANVNIFKSQGRALNKYAKKNVKVLVVGNPANTNCLIAFNNAPSIPKENFTCLTRLDENRAKAQVALKLNTNTRKIKNVIIWGNHSPTLFPDLSYAQLLSNDGASTGVLDLIDDEYWIKNNFIPCVQERGSSVIAARKRSSAMSAAKAICDHLKTWFHGTPENEWVSMGVISDGSYGIEKNLVFSFPVQIDTNKNWSIVKDLDIDDWSRSMIDHTQNELIRERSEALKVDNSD